ncbi:MAG: 50S ribosomal protein L14e [Candidatus Hadarchaeota archaeon]
MDVGKVCVKVAGKDAGKKCAIVEVLDKDFVIVSGPGMKRKRCNIAHLEPTGLKLDISVGASDEEVKRALEAAEAGRV